MPRQKLQGGFLFHSLAGEKRRGNGRQMNGVRKKKNDSDEKAQPLCYLADRMPALLLSLCLFLSVCLSLSFTLSFSPLITASATDINGTSLVCKRAKMCAPPRAVYYSRPLGWPFHMASHMALSSIN